MLDYLHRMIPLAVGAFMRRDGSLVSRIERRVRLRELDINWHMNQAVYAQVMEMGRADWFIRSLAQRRWRGLGITPVVASQHIVYRREMRFRVRYTIDTRALGMNGRLLRVQTYILVGTQAHARNDTELLLIGPNGVLGAEDSRAACEGLLTEPLAVDDWRLVGR